MEGDKKGKGRMEGAGEAEVGGVGRPKKKKSIVWEERAEVICAVRAQRGRANRGGGVGGGQSETVRPGVQRQN